MNCWPEERQWFGLREAGSAINYRQSTSRFPNLLVYDLDLFIDHFASEAVNLQHVPSSVARLL